MKLAQIAIFGRSSSSVYRCRADQLGAPRNKAELEEVRCGDEMARMMVKREEVM